VAPAAGKTGILSGGGSGHEPMQQRIRGPRDTRCGLSRPGVLFAHAPARSKRLTRAGGAGVQHVVKNCTGDIMNFAMAAELCQAQGLQVRTVAINGDRRGERQPLPSGVPNRIIARDAEEASPGCSSGRPYPRDPELPPAAASCWCEGLFSTLPASRFFFQGRGIPCHNVGSRLAVRATPRARTSLQHGQDGLLAPRNKGIPRVQKPLTEAPAVCLNFCGRRRPALASLKDLGDFLDQIEEVVVAVLRNGTE